MAADYSVAIVDLLGNTRAFVEAQDLSITTRINGGLDGSFKLDVLDPKAAEAIVASRAVKVYRNGILRAHGKIAEPLDDDQDWTTIHFADPFYWLGLRRVQAQTTYTNTDAGTIAWNLISDQEARGAIRLRRGAHPTSHKRTRVYEAGKVVSEAITELAEVEDGFFFRIDPVDGVAGTHAEFVILYPDAGADQAAVRFEYGDGTIDNLSGFQRELRNPKNSITAVGNGPRASKSDATSIAEYDLIEDEISFSSVRKKATLREHAQEALILAPLATYTVTPTSESPLLWDDFNVGDSVRLTIHHGRVDVSDLAVRVNEVTVNVDNDGTESLSDLVMEAV